MDDGHISLQTRGRKYLGVHILLRHARFLEMIEVDMTTGAADNWAIEGVLVHNARLGKKHTSARRFAM